MYKYRNVPNIVLFPLLIWFILSFVKILADPIGNFPIFFFSEINVIFGTLFSVIINYYVSGEIKFYMNQINLDSKLIKFLSCLVNIAFFITTFLILVSIFRLYMNKFVII